MNAQELAALIDGRDLRVTHKELTREEEKLAADAGLVVVFGASDDLIEFRGAIRDELGAYNGTKVFLTNAGLPENKCAEGCPYHEEEEKKGALLTAHWCNDAEGQGFTWTYRTTIPHHSFTLLEGDDKFCRGIVFALADVPPPKQQTYREQDIINWGIARNLIGPNGEATRAGQQAKTESEVGEILEAIELDDIDKARDGIGDVYVTLVMQAEMWGLTMQECIDQAWKEIKDRKGRMVNGIFVKEADLPPELRT